jgi:transposase
VVRRTLADAQKGAAQEGRTVVWVDESGFYLLPGCVRTYAPRGRTPVLRVRLTRDHLSAIGAVTPDGALLLHVRDRALRGPDVVRFLRHLLVHLPGKLLVIWDGAPIHRGRAVTAFLAGGAARRLRLEPLPGYAPDLNPLDQGIWQHLKHVELANVCCTDLRHLRRELQGATKRLRHKPHLIRGAIRHAGYDLSPLRRDQ